MVKTKSYVFNSHWPLVTFDSSKRYNFLQEYREERGLTSNTLLWRWLAAAGWDVVAGSSGMRHRVAGQGPTN
jgi:hypothetical protein